MVPSWCEQGMFVVFYHDDSARASRCLWAWWARSIAVTCFPFVAHAMLRDKVSAWRALEAAAGLCHTLVTIMEPNDGPLVNRLAQILPCCFGMRGGAVRFCPASAKPADGEASADRLVASRTSCTTARNGTGRASGISCACNGITHAAVCEMLLMLV